MAVGTVAAPRPRPGAAAVAWHAVRPFSLTVAVVPVVVATAALVPLHAATPLTGLACLLVAVLLQAGTNAINDAEDAGTGADDVATAMPSLALREGWVGPHGARLIGLACLGAAAAVGLVTALAVGRPLLLLLGAAGAAIGWAYTAPPLRLAYRPLGELASGLPMGLGITVGTALAEAGRVPKAVWWASVPLVLLTAGILHANNARDREHDALVGKRTLATRLSPEQVVWEYRVLTAGVPVVLVAGLALRGLPWECALALVPGALAARAAVAARLGLDARQWTGLLLRCVKLHLLTGVALTVGLLLSGIG